VISSRALSVCSPEVADVLLTDRVIY